jgi:hypothetical protein
MKKNRLVFSFDSSDTSDWQKIAIITLFLASSFFAYFYMLTAFPVMLWDEGMFAVQAIEMVENNNWLIPHFNGVPDTYNNKPPLTVWCIALSYKVFGINELALRLPSALCGFFTSITLFYFVWKYSQNILFGFTAALVLNTSVGFIGTHICKTGEADAILTFFVTLFLLAFFLYIETEDIKKKRTYLLIFTLSITLASLTKSVSALLILPGIFIYILMKRRLWIVLKNKEIYFSVAFFLFINFIYYFLREYFEPGHFRLLMERDILNRYFDHYNHQHQESFMFYIDNLILKRYVPWIFILPLASFILFYIDKYKNINLYLTLIFVTLLLTISFSKTKLFWYDEFLYPVGAIIIGLAVGVILEKCLIKKSAQIICFCLLCIAPFSNVISSGLNLQLIKNEYGTNYSIILASLKEDRRDIKNIKVFSKAYPSHLLFYKKVLEDSVFKFNISNSINTLTSGQSVVVCDKNLQRFLEVCYTCDILYISNGCITYRIKDKKDNFLEKKFMQTKNEILNNREWIFNIKQKAFDSKITIDKQATKDAIYFLKENKEINEEEAGILRENFLNSLP